MSQPIRAIILLLFTSCTQANVANDILMNWSAEQKTLILSNIVNAAGEGCLPVSSFYQGMDTYNSAYWNLSCADGRSFVIQIANDNQATTTIFPCAAMKSLGAECFKRFGY